MPASSRATGRRRGECWQDDSSAFKLGERIGMAEVAHYNPRQPDRTLLYRTVAEHFETWFELASAGQFDGQGEHLTPLVYVEKAFRKHIGCAIFAHGFDLQRDKSALNAAQCDTASLHLGASLNTHVHFCVCMVDGVFESLADRKTIEKEIESNHSR